MYIFKLPNAAAGKIVVTGTAATVLNLITTAGSAANGIPGRVNAIDITPEDGDIRVTFDGNTPTAVNGFLVRNGSTQQFRNVPVAKMRAIRTGGSNVACSLQLGVSSMGEQSSLGGVSGSSGLTMGTTTVTGGATTEVFFNLAGVLTSDPGFTYDPATNKLTLNGPIMNSVVGQGLWSPTNTGTNAGRIFTDDASGSVMAYGTSSVSVTSGTASMSSGGPSSVTGGSTGNGTTWNTGVITSSFAGAWSATRTAAASSGSVVPFTFTTAADTNQTLSTEVIGFRVNQAQTKQWATGALTTQRANVFDAPTYSGVGVMTIATATTLEITGAPTAGTNVTITDAFALRVPSGRSLIRFDSTNGIEVGAAFCTMTGTTNSIVSVSNTTGARLTCVTSTFSVVGSGMAGIIPAQNGVPTNFIITGGAHTALTASTENIGVTFNMSQSKQHSTGALTLQREVLFQAPTYTGVGLMTIASAFTVEIDGAPIVGTNVSITNKAGLRVLGGITTSGATNEGFGMGSVMSGASGCTGLGQGSTVTSANGIAIGCQAPSAGGIVIGGGSQTTSVTGGNFVVGGGFTSITQCYFGNGITNASPGAVTLQATGASGADQVGVALTLAGGKATGNGAGGSVIFVTSTAGASSSTLQTLNQRFRVDGTTGRFVMTSMFETVSGNEQTTVGAAGGGSALPISPTKYIKFIDSTGATLVMPAYAAA